MVVGIVCVWVKIDCVGYGFVFTNDTSVSAKNITRYRRTYQDMIRHGRKCNNTQIQQTKVNINNTEEQHVFFVGSISFFFSSSLSSFFLHALFFNVLPHAAAAWSTSYVPIIFTYCILREKHHDDQKDNIAHQRSDAKHQYKYVKE